MNNERREFLNTLGWDLVIAKLGVSETALNQSIRRGFAASWYDVLDEIAVSYTHLTLPTTPYV